MWMVSEAPKEIQTLLPRCFVHDPEHYTVQFLRDSKAGDLDLSGSLTPVATLTSRSPQLRVCSLGAQATYLMVNEDSIATLPSSARRQIVRSTENLLCLQSFGTAYLVASPKERASQRKMIIDQKAAKLSSMDVAEI